MKKALPIDGSPIDKLLLITAQVFEAVGGYFFALLLPIAYLRPKAVRHFIIHETFPLILQAFYWQ